MHLPTVAGLIALSGAAAAFSDSSPWVLLSTSKFHDTPSANQIQTSSQVLKYTKSVLSECLTDRYLVVSQPGLSAADLRQVNDCALPHLCRLGRDARMRGKYTVSEVVGELGESDFAKHIEAACSKKGKKAQIEELRLPSLPADDRAGSLAQNDAILAEHLKTAADGNDFTVLLFSSPSEPFYEAGFDQPVRIDLKKRQDSPALHRANKTEMDRLPLFEKYQFFTPGIYMGIIAVIVLLSILSVGVRALGSIEISYGAFEKEMGPAAQKKSQ